MIVLTAKRERKEITHAECLVLSTVPPAHDDSDVLFPTEQEFCFSNTTKNNHPGDIICLSKISITNDHFYK